jgi:hypothetical protein
MKYEAKIKDAIKPSYGVWNNDMQSWQYINEWMGTETCHRATADKMAYSLYLKSLPETDSFKGCGMGTF